METYNIIKEKRAIAKLQKLKGFYKHTMVYIIMNSVLLVIKIVGTLNYGEYFMGPLWHFSTLATPLFWGIGLAAHGLGVFGLGKAWEERQLKKYMNESNINENPN